METTTPLSDPVDGESPASARGTSVLASRFLRRYFPALATGAQVVLDAVTVFAACVTAYMLWSRIQPLPRAVPFREYLPLFIAITAVMLGLFTQFRMYRSQKTILNIEEFKGVFKSVVLGMMFVGLIHFMLEESVIYPRASGSESTLYRVVAEVHHAVAIVPSDTYSRYVLVLSFLLVFLFLSVERWICFKVLQYLHVRGVGTTNILIVGAGRLGRMIQKTLFLSPRLGYNLVGFLDDDSSRVGEPVAKSRILGTTEQLEKMLADYKVGLVLVAFTNLDKGRRARFAETCRRLGVEIAFVPPLHVSDSLPPLRMSTVESIPLLTFSSVRPGPVYRLAKRTLDIVISVIGIAFFTFVIPFFLVLPILIRLESRGPALFRQSRVGKDGKLFDIFKFRSMRSDLPKYQESPRSHDDPRLTRIGRVLRRTSLDELPQLFNVLRGDMSVVGPRPEMPFIVASYDANIRQRLRAKPGITGLWQISYARDEDIHENVDYDLYYVEHPSLTMDVVIIILTAFSVIRGVGAH